MAPQPTPPPPSAAQALEHVNSLHAEAVGRNTLVMVEGLRRRLTFTNTTELIVALTLARLGRATVAELAAELRNLLADPPPADGVGYRLRLLAAAGLATVRTDERGEVWTAAAR